MVEEEVAKNLEIEEEVVKNLKPKKQGRKLMRGFPQRKVVKVYLTVPDYAKYRLHAMKMGIAMSELFKVSIFEYIYRPRMGPRRESPILRIDRSPKGSRINVEKNNFKQVVSDLKKFDITTLVKVKEKDKRHIYNIYAKGKVVG